MKNQTLERDERQAEHEERLQQAERSHQLEMIKREKELLELKGQTGNPQPQTAFKPPKVKIPSFQENRDNLDAYIERFERYARSQEWPKKDWSLSLSALLQGKALEVYSRMPLEDTNDYDKLKSALLKRFQMTEEGYRVRFRTSRPEKSETPSQFAGRLSSYFTR